MTHISGADLREGDTIEVWWQPNRDTIIGLKPYFGPLDYVFPSGAQIATFAILKTGTTIDNSDIYNVIARTGK